MSTDVNLRGFEPDRLGADRKLMKSKYRGDREEIRYKLGIG